MPRRRPVLAQTRHLTKSRHPPLLTSPQLTLTPRNLAKPSPRELELELELELKSMCTTVSRGPHVYLHLYIDSSPL